MENRELTAYNSSKVLKIPLSSESRLLIISHILTLPRAVYKCVSRDGCNTTEEDHNIGYSHGNSDCTLAAHIVYSNNNHLKKLYAFLINICFTFPNF